MSRTTTPGKRRGLSAIWDGAGFRVTKGERSLFVPVQGTIEESQLLVELDELTHWQDSGKSGSDDLDELTIEELHAILEAVEDEAERMGVSIEFE